MMGAASLIRSMNARGYESSIDWAGFPFKDSARKLRDSAMTFADYELRKSRDIATAGCSEGLKVRSDSRLCIFEQGDSPGDGAFRESPLAKAERTPPIRRESVAIRLLVGSTRLNNSVVFGRCVTWRIPLPPPFASLRIRSTA